MSNKYKALTITNRLLTVSNLLTIGCRLFFKTNVPPKLRLKIELNYILFPWRGL